MENNLLQQEEKLQNSMMALNKPHLSDIRKRMIRDNLLNKISLSLETEIKQDLGLFGSLILAIKKLASPIKINNILKASLKERILDAAERHTQKTFFWSNFWSISKKLASASLIFVLTFSLVSFWNMDVSVVRAATFTNLETFNGDVSIERNGQRLVPKAGMKILKNDKISTGASGEAVIKYLDDSISRLSNNTDVHIKELSQLKDNDSQTYVEIFIDKGVLWSKVVNLLESDSSFVVKTKNGFATAKKAAFNVEVNQNTLEIGVFNHVVEVSAKGETGRIVSGEKLILANTRPQITSIKESEKKEEWIRENLASDRQYVAKIEEEKLLAKVEAVGSKPEEDISNNQSIKEDTLLLLTFDDLKKQKIKLDLAEKSFIAAQVKLHDPNLSPEQKQKAEEIMTLFAAEVKNSYKLAEKAEKNDPKYSKELKDYLNSKLIAQKKDLSGILPDSPVYSAKKILEELELLKATDESQFAEIKIDQAIEKLAAVEEIKDRGDQELAAEVAGEYKEDINGVIDLLDGIEASDFKEELATKVSQDIDILQAIEVVTDQDIGELKDNVESIIAKETPGILIEITDITITRDPPKKTTPKITEPEKVMEGPYGVTIQGDKALPPMLE